MSLRTSVLQALITGSSITSLIGTGATNADVSETGAGALKNANKPISELWSLFTAHKVSSREWSEDEAKSSTSTLWLLISVIGDGPARDATPDKLAHFRSVYQGLPAKWGQTKPWVEIYATHGAREVVAESVNLKLDRTTDKSWNKQYSRLGEFFTFAESKFGLALPAGTPNPCKDLFIEIDKSKLSWQQDWERRRCYTDTLLSGRVLYVSR